MALRLHSKMKVGDDARLGNDHPICVRGREGNRLRDLTSKNQAMSMGRIDRILEEVFM